MKKVFLGVIITAVVFISCSKEGNENDENLCPVVAAGLVPQVVKDSFAIKYPATAVTTWFNKDSVAYCAFFTISGVNKLAQFANNGNFIKEEIEIEQEGDHQDTTGKTTGCVCEVQNGD